MLIAAHNSVTGEKSKGLLSKLVAPFSICQTKTIRQQLDCGVTYFDIRIRKEKDKWICAHGLYKIKRSAKSILQQIDDAAQFRNIYVRLTYENWKPISDPYSVLPEMEEFAKQFTNIKWTEWRVKNPFFIFKEFNKIKCEECYAPIYKGHKELWFPIPWFWRKDVPFNNSVYKMVDFV